LTGLLASQEGLCSMDLVNVFILSSLYTCHNLFSESSRKTLYIYNKIKFLFNVSYIQLCTTGEHYSRTMGFWENWL